MLLTTFSALDEIFSATSLSTAQTHFPCQIRFQEDLLQSVTYLWKRRTITLVTVLSSLSFKGRFLPYRPIYVFTHLVYTDGSTETPAHDTEPSSSAAAAAAAVKKELLPKNEKFLCTQEEVQYRIRYESIEIRPPGPRNNSATYTEWCWHIRGTNTLDNNRTER